MKVLKRFYYATSDDITLGDINVIHENAFENDATINRVFAPNVHTIGAKAFMNCEKLGVFSLDLKILEFDALVFPRIKNNSGDEGKKENANNQNKYIHIQYQAFKGCSQLSCVILNEHNKTVGKYTPRTKVIIENEAFAGCYSLRTVVLYASDVQIADNAFIGCPNVVFVSRSKDVERYARENNFKYIKL